MQQVVGLGVNAYLQMLLEDSYVHTGQTLQHLHARDCERLWVEPRAHVYSSIMSNIACQSGKRALASPMCVCAADLHPGNIFVARQVKSLRCVGFDFCLCLRTVSVLLWHCCLYNSNLV